MRNRWKAAVAAGLMVCLLCGCSLFGQKKEAGFVILDPVPPIDAPVYEGSDIAGSPFVGEFINTFCAIQASRADGVYIDEEHTPKLTCNADGTFVLTVVSDMVNHKMRDVKGTFTVDGETAEFVPDGMPDAAFQAKMVNKDELRIVGEGVDSVTNGDIFGRINE